MCLELLHAVSMTENLSKFVRSQANGERACQNLCCIILCSSFPCEGMAGIPHLPGDGNRPRLSWDVDPWQGLARLWEAGDGLCCGVTGEGAGGSERWHGILGCERVGKARVSRQHQASPLAPFRPQQIH